MGREVMRSAATMVASRCCATLSGDRVVVSLSCGLLEGKLPIPDDTVGKLLNYSFT
jgi:hypothetical protein